MVAHLTAKEVYADPTRLSRKQLLEWKILRAQCAAIKFKDPIMEDFEFDNIVSEYEALCAIFGETPYVSRARFDMIRYSCQLVYKTMLLERSK